MGANAETNATSNERFDVGRFQIFLAEVDAERAVLQRQLPVVIDEELDAVDSRARNGLAYFSIEKD